MSSIVVTPFKPAGPAGARDQMAMTAKQAAFYLSTMRFNMAPCGRRSGKTAIAKRRGVKKALRWTGAPARFIFAAPTHQQAENIFWRDLKMLVPRWARLNSPSESDLTIELLNGAMIQVMGMDKPQRAEGSPAAHFCLDEFADMKEETWGNHVRPMLTDTQGTADIVGVPEGRNHYWEMWNQALDDESGEWGTHHWTSAEVLPMYLGAEAARREIASARAAMDDLTFRQEFEADFNNFEGRAYYPFERKTHAVERLRYDPNLPLILCLDFNVSPGVCVYVQEQEYKGKDPEVGETFTAVIGEVHIPRDSNTHSVCRKILYDWGPLGQRAEHDREVLVYGDATGGARSTKSENGSDWDIVRAMLRPIFGEKLRMRHKHENPPERVRVNSMNSRLQAADGTKRMLIDPRNAPRVIEDLEAVCVKEGTAGEIDKDTNKKITHLTDALGYYVESKHPITGASMRSETAFGG